MTARSVLRVAGWNLLFLAVVLIAAEALFGGWFRGGGLGSLHVPRGVELRHDVGAVRPGGGIVTYRRDRWGLRGSHSGPAEIDILAVGGSTTNELYLDESETWAAVLQRRFAEAGRTVVVGNAGVDGHSTVGHLRSLESWFPRVPALKPKLVVFYIGINDVHVVDHQRYDAIVPQDGWSRFGRYVSNNSALAHLLRTVQGMARAQQARVGYRNDPPKLEPADAAAPDLRPADHEAALAAYAGRIRALAAATRALNARPVFITQRRGDAFGSAGRTMAAGQGAVKARALLALYNDAAMAACRDAGALCIDLAADIDLAPNDFIDAVHTGPAGSRKIGDYLFGKLEDAL